MNPMLSLYQEIILDHNRHPRNFGHLDPCTHKAQGFNPLCGDKVLLTLNVGDEDKQILEIAFEGTGCAISVASASLMTERVKGKTVHEAAYLFDSMHDLLTRDNANADLEPLGKLAALSGVRAYPSRVKCASLCWHTLKTALEQPEKQTVSTE